MNRVCAISPAPAPAPATAPAPGCWPCACHHCPGRCHRQRVAKWHPDNFFLAKDKQVAPLRKLRNAKQEKQTEMAGSRMAEAEKNLLHRSNFKKTTQLGVPGVSTTPPRS